MKSALLSKIAMCICPPAIVATSVATIPPIKRAVHRATATSPVPAARKAHPRRAMTTARDCAPGLAVAALTPQGAPLQRLSDAMQTVGNAPIFDAPGFTAQHTPGYQMPAAGVAWATAPGLAPLGALPVEEVPSSPLPEASTWAMTIGGFAAVGIALRRRPTAKPVARDAA
jgi:hypothetical protein